MKKIKLPRKRKKVFCRETGNINYLRTIICLQDAYENTQIKEFTKFTKTYDSKSERWYLY